MCIRDRAVQDRPCGMAAVLMLGREQLAECCRQAGEAGVVEIANYNCPTQLVIAGDAAAVEKAGELALQAAVSYTHLDVYKRQALGSSSRPSDRLCRRGSSARSTWRSTAL